MKKSMTTGRQATLSAPDALFAASCTAAFLVMLASLGNAVVLYLR